MKTVISMIAFAFVSTASADTILGSVQVSELMVPADAKVITIKGAAARDLYVSFTAEVDELDHETKQKVGENIACIKTKDDNKPSKYTCEIILLNGVAQQGAKG